MLALLIKYLHENNSLTSEKLQELKKLKDEFMKYVNNNKYFIKGSGFYTLDEEIMKQLNNLLD